MSLYNNIICLAYDLQCVVPISHLALVWSYLHLQCWLLIVLSSNSFCTYWESCYILFLMVAWLSQPCKEIQNQCLNSHLYIVLVVFLLLLWLLNLPCFFLFSGDRSCWCHSYESYYCVLMGWFSSASDEL